MRVWWLVIIAGLSIEKSHGSKVLILTPIGFKSHTIFYRGLAKALIEGGHEVTQVLPYNNSAASGAREVVLPVPNINELIGAFQHGTIGLFKFFSEHVGDLSINAYTTKEFTDIRKEHFDIVLFSEWGCLVFFEYIKILEVPYILLMPLGMGMSTIATNVGNPFFASFVPSIFLDHPPSPDGLTYMQRIISVPLEALFYFGEIMNLEYTVPKILKENGVCSNDCADIYALKRNFSLMIMNSFRTLEDPVQPHVPAVIHAGGIHINQAKSLPPELEQWVAEAGEEGFILFSLGSVVKPSDMPEDTRAMLVKVLGSLKQRVLWKWDKDNMQDLPSNVKISKWLPQQDILAHSSLKLFMTHGGLHSTQEAFYNGVPVLGFPVFSDQSMNMATVEAQGWGRVVNWKGLSEDILREAILDTLSNQKYRIEAKRRQRIAQDQLISPQETVNYWVDYVIRHNGARHLDSPIKYMPWYKVYNVDVWLVLISSLILSFVITLKLLICICSSCRSRIKKKKTE